MNHIISPIICNKDSLTPPYFTEKRDATRDRTLIEIETIVQLIMVIKGRRASPAGCLAYFHMGTASPRELSHSDRIWCHSPHPPFHIREIYGSTSIIISLSVEINGPNCFQDSSRLEFLLSHDSSKFLIVDEFASKHSGSISAIIPSSAEILGWQCRRCSLREPFKFQAG
jgi:hypothetical protein